MCLLREFFIMLIFTSNKNVMSHSFLESLTGGQVVKNRPNGKMKNIKLLGKCCFLNPEFSIFKNFLMFNIPLIMHPLAQIEKFNLLKGLEPPENNSHV